MKSRRMRWAGHVARMGEERNVYKVLVGKPEGKRPLGRPRRRFEDGIRMDLREIGLGSVDWIQLARDRERWRALVNTVMNLRVLTPRSLFVSWLVSDRIYISKHIRIEMTFTPVSHSSPVTSGCFYGDHIHNA
jgi:hypothetical protein